MYRTLKTSLAAGATCALAAYAAVAASMSEPARAPNDLEIAHSAYTAGDIDIRYAHLALGLSEEAAVRGFAETMIRDHADAAGALVKQLGSSRRTTRSVNN